MVCLPCQKKAEARKAAMINQMSKTNPQAAKIYDKNTNITKILPRYDGTSRPITNTKVKPKTIWNEAYQAFVMNPNK